ncbi:hypothetical protein EVAR_98376_1 [Eumeta japonica]|uniref:Uncharacterized protein n=1 Tax=Eumeta variegata TaxID=151549 RepID=A0A4C2A5L2_EUMVA|nr:hypothetical protein EVAR_98376_1 [Eumeta japonica]
MSFGWCPIETTRAVSRRARLSLSLDVLLASTIAFAATFDPLWADVKGRSTSDLELKHPAGGRAACRVAGHSRLPPAGRLHDTVNNDNRTRRSASRLRRMSPDVISEKNPHRRGVGCLEAIVMIRDVIVLTGVSRSREVSRRSRYFDYEMSSLVFAETQ